MMKLVCEKHGEIPKARFDGYLIGDTMLEDVWFEVRVENDKLIVECSEEDREYLEENFNAEKWLERAREFVSNPNNWDDLVCPKCYEEDGEAGTVKVVK